MRRRHLSAKQREQLYADECTKAKEAGRGEFPICHHCDLPIIPGQMWDAAHDKHKPNWLGGEIAGCAHSRCNRSHNNKVDTPKFAKAERVRKNFLDLKRSNSRPIVGSKRSNIKIPFHGRPIDRRTGERL